MLDILIPYFVKALAANQVLHHEILSLPLPFLFPSVPLLPFPLPY
jgi:hypothetical protein